MAVRVYRNRVAIIVLVVLTVWVYVYYYYITSPGGDLDENAAKMDHIERLREHLSEGDLKEVVINSEESIKLAKSRKLVLRKGLDFDEGKFTLNGKPHVILSGAMHYFRVPVAYWRDRMLKMKACGLNTLETYVPWNLHEETEGEFTFSQQLDVRKYIMLAEEVGLQVIFRPGPYICSEWDFGGLPSWLLKDANMKVRTNYKEYIAAVSKYFTRLLSQVSDLQYSLGGPIIAVQIENEYGSFSSDVSHLKFLKDLLLGNGITELLLTSDNEGGIENAKHFDNVLVTGNFDKVSPGSKVLEAIHNINPKWPLMVTEFWSGWFDMWGDKEHASVKLDFSPKWPLMVTEFWSGWFDMWGDKEHASVSDADLKESLTFILDKEASVNFYMFHGGTNFGFMAGAQQKTDGYQAMVTSYDYDAPLTEAGDITSKYTIIRELLLEKVLKPQGITQLPPVPPNTKKTDYGAVEMTKYLPWEQLLALKSRIDLGDPIPMENLKMRHNCGQTFGFIVYQAVFKTGKQLKISGNIRDRGQVLLDGKEIYVIEVNSKDVSVTLPSDMKPGIHTLDIVVENMGRVNYVHDDLQQGNLFNEQRKGLSGSVLLDSKNIQSFGAFPLEFKADYMTSVKESSQWRDIPAAVNQPAMFKGVLTISGTPADTFINMEGWTKGVVFVNGINIGRYWDIGPQKTLYIPASYLHSGKNDIFIFELHNAAKGVTLDDKPQL